MASVAAVIAAVTNSVTSSWSLGIPIAQQGLSHHHNTATPCSTGCTAQPDHPLFPASLARLVASNSANWRCCSRALLLGVVGGYGVQQDTVAPVAMARELYGVRHHDGCHLRAQWRYQAATRWLGDLMSVDMSRRHAIQATYLCSRMLKSSKYYTAYLEFVLLGP